MSIATLTGENGILTRANEAKTNTEQAEEDELRRLTALEAATNLENQLYKDKNEDTATIPAGFAVSQVEGENTIDDGLVIIDKNGNEFVWIPVSDINEMAQCSTAGGNCNLILQNDQLICETHNNIQIVGKLYATIAGENFIENPNATYVENSGFREADVVSDYDGKKEYLNIITEILIGEENKSKYASITAFKETMQEDYSLMAKSVAEYKGFYIGRYEMSKSESNIVQSKANSISLSARSDSANTWYGLYAYGKTYINNTNSVESSMIWGSQYDAMMNWMKKNGENVTAINDDIKNTDEIYTGPEGDRDVIKHIYDLYGGKLEWTLEAESTYGRVYRGRFL